MVLYALDVMQHISSPWKAEKVANICYILQKPISQSNGNVLTVTLWFKIHE